MPFLSFENVTYSVGGRTILDQLSFEIEKGETLVLLGRSGSGKTTALRLINRMLKPTSGTVRIEGRNTSEANEIELRRRTGYVIQEFGLLPHWTAEENVALVLRLLGWSMDRQRQRAGELLEQVGLNAREVGSRLPQQLSGGQRQRVGVARALAAEPKLLLFDEPFGALDPVTRHEMQQQFRDIRSRYDVASVFVTHDLLEALSIATRIAVLHRGRLEVIATPDEFYSVTTPVARAFLDTLPEQMLSKEIKPNEDLGAKSAHGEPSSGK